MLNHTLPRTPIPVAFDQLHPGDLVSWASPNVTERAIITSEPNRTTLLDGAVRYEVVLVSESGTYPSTRIYDARDNAHLARAVRRRRYSAADLLPAAVSA